MSGWPVISGRELSKALARAGFELSHQKGSHMVLRRMHKPHRRLTVPDHQEMAKGTLAAIARESGLGPDRLKHLLAAA
ncbi:MAG: type II toxin-antitoxin system HicA family toxin [Desulfarculaceae bacterium]|nr:type II toxin-antitoxin system HicA family toxin [Desulfarculaceae bacterium]MCF8070862.1 type II toxin-antitoxin system HicA family toxin [Desulfarculaceae bacterium]MCF8100450.1 type II toxin-antitoxin system HicA family toxin [Desulfarculaceae bacterium]MCF8117964.1 type II toxin-antitoxin system HicA family toxin [Desulfarculaceae bacterium]